MKVLAFLLVWLLTVMSAMANTESVLLAVALALLGGVGVAAIMIDTIDPSIFAATNRKGKST